MNPTNPGSEPRCLLPAWARTVSGFDDSHRRAMDLFFRLLAGVYAIAFVSLAVQIRGLLGEEGLLPAGPYLIHMQEMLGSRAWTSFPSIFWINSTDEALLGACWAGAGFSVLIALGYLQAPLFLVNWLLYLSLLSVGQVFLRYQWDILLLEAGFLAIWAAPWRLRAARAGSGEPSLPLVWLFRWLLFRLMFSSGWVKITTDEVWRNLSALDFHYWTQPLPTWTAWWMHQGPVYLGQTGVALTLFVECLAPWLILAGRKGRKFATVSLAGFQLALIFTGNFGFFNLLSLALCVPLWSQSAASPPESVDNESLTDDSPTLNTSEPGYGLRRFRRTAGCAFALLMLVLSMGPVIRTERPGFILPYPIDVLERALAPFYVVNRYGLFADMTEERPEIILEISSDGDAWQAVPFRRKPGPLDARPTFTYFHMPRLDWQMWFEGLNYLAQDQSYERGQVPPNERRYYPNRWFFNLAGRILAGENSTTRLLAWPSREPSARFVRARVYRYQFTTPREREISGDWWKREFSAVYLPRIPREDF